MELGVADETDQVIKFLTIGVNGFAREEEQVWISQSKKLLALMIALAMISLGVVGCGQGANSAAESPDNATESSESSESAEAAPAEEADASKSESAEHPESSEHPEHPE